ncbi:hypothetical protein TURU_034400 [Turdus rufiventris]|nr:hypothetical protein TURU_034400 [Turdus rufiventris]
MEGHALVTGWVSEGSWRTVRLEVVGSGSGTVFGSAVVVLMAVAVIAGFAELAVESVPAELAAAAGFVAAVDAGAAEDAEAVEAGSSGMSCSFSNDSLKIGNFKKCLQRIFEVHDVSLTKSEITIDNNPFSSGFQVVHIHSASAEKPKRSVPRAWIQQRASQIRGLEYLSYKDRLRDQSLLSLEKNQLRGDLINVYKYLKGGCQEDVSKLLVVPSSRTRGNGQRMLHRKFYLHMRKKFFNVQVTEHKNRQPREDMQSPSLEMPKNCRDAILWNVL